MTEANEADADKPQWTVAHAFGEIVWLMTQSAGYKHHALADLEWLVMPALLLEQYRIFHEGSRPVGAVLWARLDAETSARMGERSFRLRPDQWRTGDGIWITDIVSAIGANAMLPAAMIQDFKKTLFPDASIWLRRINMQTQSIDIIKLREHDVGVMSA